MHEYFVNIPTNHEVDISLSLFYLFYFIVFFVFFHFLDTVPRFETTIFPYSIKARLSDAVTLILKGQLLLARCTFYF